jgi:hypothetical protein
MIPTLCTATYARPGPGHCKSLFCPVNIDGAAVHEVPLNRYSVPVDEFIAKASFGPVTHAASIAAPFVET